MLMGLACAGVGSAVVERQSINRRQSAEQRMKVRFIQQFRLLGIVSRHHKQVILKHTELIEQAHVCCRYIPTYRSDS